MPLLAILVLCAVICAPVRGAGAADVDELLRLEGWLHGPPVPAEPLWAYA
jgi:hypothetical protein